MEIADGKSRAGINNKYNIMASVVSGHIKTMTYTGYYKQNLVHWGICDIILHVTLNNTESINHLQRWIIITA